MFRASTDRSSRSRRAGLSLIYVAMVGAVMFGFASLAVDYGRRQVAKTELRRAADAAARAAISAVGNPAEAERVATQFAAANLVDGKPVKLDAAAGDIQFVRWDAEKRTYEILTGSARGAANAIRIRPRASVPLVWAAVFGQDSIDVHADAIACAGYEGYGVIGLESITMTGKTVDSYWSSTGQTGGEMGNVASNGDITLKGGATIHGNARSYAGQVKGGSVTGSTAGLPTELVFPNGEATPYFNSNSNASASAKLTGNNFNLGKNQTFTLPGGVYVFNNFTTSSGSKLTFLGPATIYCYGQFSMSGQTTTDGNQPENLKLIMCPDSKGSPPGDLKLSGGTSLYMQVYAPQSKVELTGDGSIYGSVLGRTVEMSGQGAIHYDMSYTSMGAITMVK